MTHSGHAQAPIIKLAIRKKRSLSVPSFAEARKSRGLEHRCFFAFISGKPFF